VIQSSPMPTSAKHKPESPAKPAIQVRLLAETDPIPEITRLLHRAYAKQVAMGLQPLAGRQDDEVTRKRVHSGDCYVALHGVKIVGTILFHEVEDAKGPPWFQQPHVDSFSQFAVDPDLQGHGIGIMLLDKAESRAIECGSTELGLSM